MLPGKQYKPADFAAIAWKRRWLIIGSTILGAYIALVVSSQLKDKYQSEMLIQVVPQRVPESYVKSTVTIRTEDRLNALSQQVMSRTQLEHLITEMDLYPAERTRMPMQDVVERMKAAIGQQVVTSQRDSRETDAFYVRFTYQDRNIAQRVTEQLGKLYINVNARDRGNLAQGTNDFLETRLNEARRDLEEQERKLEIFRQRNAGRLPTQLQFNMQAIQSAQSEVQTVVDSLARDRDRKLMLERLRTDAEREPALPVVIVPQTTGLGQPADSATPTGASAEQQLALAREALARAEVRLKPEHPDLKRLKRQIEELEARIAQESSSTAGGAKPVAPTVTPEQLVRRQRLQTMQAEIESLDRQIKFKESQEQRLRATIGDYQRRIEQVPGVESEWISLSRDYDTKQASYKDLLKKSEESKVAAELEKGEIGEQFRVLDPARVPIRPTGILRIQVNLIGTAVGLMLGLLVTALLEIIDTSFHTTTDVSDVLQLSVIALIPSVVDAVERQRRRQAQLLVSAAVAVAVVAGGYGFWALRLWKHLT